MLSLLLLIRSHIDAREFDWYVHRVHFPPRVRRTFFQAGGVLAALIVALSWMAPVGADDKNLDRLNEFLSGEPFAELADLWNRLFSSLRARASPRRIIMGRAGGARWLIRLGDQPVMGPGAAGAALPLERRCWTATALRRQLEWRHIRRRAHAGRRARMNIGDAVAMPEVQQDDDDRATRL